MAYQKGQNFKILINIYETMLQFRDPPVPVKRVYSLATPPY